MNPASQLLFSTAAGIKPSSPSVIIRNWVTAGLLMVLAWAFYLPTLKYDYIYYDDVRILKDHPELYGQASLGSDLHAIFVTAFPREEPLLVRDVVWAVESRMFGFPNPFGYHLGNVILHGVVVALLFIFLVRTTRRYEFALIVAGMYLALAVHMEPVAWIMGLKDILSALFMLLALLAQSQRLAAQGKLAQSGWFMLTLIFFAAGLLSKISVLTFPMVLWLHAVLQPYVAGELAPAERFNRWRTFLRETVLLVPTMALSVCVYVWYQRTLEAMNLFARGYNVHGLAHLWNLLMTNPIGFWLYLCQIFLPYHLALEYPWPQLQANYPVWQIVVALSTVTAALGAGLWLLFRRKDLFFYYAIFFVLMIPYLNLQYIGIWVADRYVYFSVFCVLAIAVSVGSEMWQQAPRLIRLALLLAGVEIMANNLYQGATYQSAWRNGETLWSYHVALPDHMIQDYDNLGACLYANFGDALARNDQPQATAALNKLQVVVDAALKEFWPDQHQPPPPETYFQFFLRSLIEEVAGKPEAALASLLMADRLRPGFDSTNLNLSRLYRKLANAATDPEQRAADLNAARDRFAEYIKIDFGKRPVSADIQQEMADLDAACAALPQHPAAPPVH